MSLYVITNLHGEELVTGTPKQIKEHLGIVFNHSLYQYHLKRSKLLGKYLVHALIKEKSYHVIYNGEKLFTGTLAEIAKKYLVGRANVLQCYNRNQKLNRKYTVASADEDIQKLKDETILNPIKKVPYTLKCTDMILHLNRKGELKYTTFLPLNQTS